MSNEGFFITFEGIEGVGKTTAVQFLQKYLENKAIPCKTTREPGGTEIAEEIRRILLTHHQEKMSSDTELLLLFAGRAQNVATIIKPALQRGEWVLCDRFNDASFAYQGGGRGISFHHIAQLSEWVLSGFQPDMTLLLDAPVEIGLERLQQRGKKDRIEQEDILFFERIRQTYLQLARDNVKRYRVIKADQSKLQVEQQIIAAVETLIAHSSILDENLND